MSGSLFADTGYWVALLNPKDDLHDIAKSVSSSVAGRRIVTTDFVLVEVLNYFAERGDNVRSSAALFVEKIKDDPNITVEPATRDGFNSAIDDYKKYNDKEYSHTDCHSFAVMRRVATKEALAYDHHFRQAGFRPLLREAEEQQQTR